MAKHSLRIRGKELASVAFTRDRENFANHQLLAVDLVVSKFSTGIFIEMPLFSQPGDLR
jgi:hypothetical protein